MSVSSAHCYECGAHWTFKPPVWLGEPWTREQVDRLMADHRRLAHVDSPTESDDE